MRRILLSSAFAVLCAATAFGQSSTLFTQYCVGCHNDTTKSGGLSLTKIDLSRPADHAEQLEKVILKMKAGMMPPPSSTRRPDAATAKSFVAELESSIDKAAAARPNPGRPVLHRLNRTEYENSVRELLDIEIDAAAFLPPDDMSEGYDNMSDVLTISPTLLEGYLSAAGKIARLAVGDPTATTVVESYTVPVSYSQIRHVEGTPFGTRGGIAVKHNFPADGEYVFIMAFYYASIGGFFGDNKPAEGEQIEVAIDGERVALLDISRKLKVDQDLRTKPIKVKSGPHVVSASFIERITGPVQDFVMPFEQALADPSTGHIRGLTGLPHLRTFGVKGPEKVTGISDSPSRQKTFICRPANAGEETACATKIVTKLGTQAFRRPVTDKDVKHLLSFFTTGRKQRDFDYGIMLAVQAVLADPEFIFRFERTPAGLPPGTNYRISDLELASRLSFFLWSSPPDEELISAAAAGRLKNAQVLEQQVKRMLADPRAEALSTNFAGHWLRLQNLKDAHPDVFIYPNWDVNLTQSMKRETELFFDSIVREDRNITDLLTADYTFVDGRLARHYKIPNIVGNRFRRIQYTDPNRRGLLGHGSVLTLTGLANRTSPVIRGAWVLEVLMGTPPPNPPANVPPLKENEDNVKALSVRERLTAHRASPACSSCHNIIDPIGYSLENFDPTGAWRTKDTGETIDPSGVFYDGTKVDGPAGLREFLKKNETLFVTNFTQNLLMYALGRVLHPYDMPAVRQIVQEAERNDKRFSAFVMSIVKSTPFQMRKAEAAPSENQAGNERD
ncbi:MAG: DUF1592 domain-containing protein [Acidobacteria bacterium]|nr:DUF1592 domain-containing protein [Acidobacteriota bacterium]